MFVYEDVAARCRNRLGPQDDTCPVCSATRKPVNRTKRVMRWWLEENRATWNCVHCGEHGYVFRHDAPMRPRKSLPPPKKTVENPNRDFALKIWHRETTALNGTLGAAYFTIHRHIDLDSLGNLFHVLRWHDGKRMVVALMRDPLTGKERGIHRIFLNPDGTKSERKMLGTKGVICISPWTEITHGLGLSEGIEDGLRISARGWLPIWAAPDAGFLKKFPVIPGIEAITIFADNDPAGLDAAQTCAVRWREQGQETKIVPANK